MDEIVNIGGRSYIFHSSEDIRKAYSIWVKPCSQDEFEELLIKEKKVFEINK